MTLSAPPDGQDRRFLRFGLMVTGRAEEKCLPKLFRSLSATGRCSFRVIRRIGQRSPIESAGRRLRMIGSGKTIPDRDAEEIGLPARRFLASGTDSRFVILVDDLERRRSKECRRVFARYRSALDTMLRPDEARRASVHFLVNMLEAYYFADARAVNTVLGTDLDDYGGDVEAIRHPKNKLKGLFPGFDEIEHGCRILDALDAGHVLSRRECCSSLRTMFAWVCKAIDEPEGEAYQLAEGCYSDVGRDQIDAVAISDREG